MNASPPALLDGSRLVRAFEYYMTSALLRILDAHLMRYDVPKIPIYKTPYNLAHIYLTSILATKKRFQIAC